MARVCLAAECRFVSAMQALTAYYVRLPPKAAYARLFVVNVDVRIRFWRQKRYDVELMMFEAEANDGSVG